MGINIVQIKRKTSPFKQFWQYNSHAHVVLATLFFFSTITAIEASEQRPKPINPLPVITIQQVNNECRFLPKSATNFLAEIRQSHLRMEEFLTQLIQAYGDWYQILSDKNSLDPNWPKDYFSFLTESQQVMASAASAIYELNDTFNAIDDDIKKRLSECYKNHEDFEKLLSSHDFAHDMLSEFVLTVADFIETMQGRLGRNTEQLMALEGQNQKLPEESLQFFLTEMDIYREANALTQSSAYWVELRYHQFIDALSSNE